MKRTLEDDIVLSAESKQALENIKERYDNAMIMAQCFLNHVNGLYQNEAMYMDSDSCFMHLSNPLMTFDWVNVGTRTDEFHILGSTSALHAFFTFIGKEGRIWKLSESDRVHCLEMLADYFAKNPQTILKIDAWDPIPVPIRIGHATQYKWEEFKDEDEDDSEEEEEKNPYDDDEVDEAAQLEELLADPFRVNKVL